MLLKRFREGITAENVLKSSNSLQRNLRDYLEDSGVNYGRASGDSIQARLFSLLRRGFGSTNPAQQGNVSAHFHNQAQAGSAKRDFLKVPRLVADQYCEPYEESILA